MNSKEIIKHLPYKEPFLFVEEIIDVNDNGIRGRFTFRDDLDFYRGHFIGNPVTPGVILTECCAQIGLACFGLYLIKSLPDKALIALSSSEMEFYQPVFPGETVEVRSEKVYFRFGKLQCQVKMLNASDKLVCKGVLSGIIKTARVEE